MSAEEVVAVEEQVEEQVEEVVAEEENVESAESAESTEAEAKPRKQRGDRPPPVKVDKPDEAAFNKLSAELEADIEKRKKTVEGLNPKIKEAIDQRSKSRATFQESLKQLRALRDVQAAAAKAREAANTKLLKLEKDMEERKKRLDSARKDLKHKNGDSIDEEIAKIEYTMTHTSLTLREEKEYMALIKQLKASKAALAQFAEEKAAIDAVDPRAALDSVRDERKAKAKELAVAKEEADKIAELVTAARKAEEKANETVVNLLAAKKFEQDKITELIERAKAERKKYRDAERAFNDWSEYAQYLRRQQIREQRRARDEARKAEEEAYAAERAAEEAQMDHWAEEKELCKQLLTYLRRVAPVEREAKADDEDAVGFDLTRRFETDDDMSFQHKGEELKVKTGRKKHVDESIIGAKVAGGKKGKKEVSAAAKAAADEEKAVAAAAARVKKQTLTCTPDLFVQFDLLDLVPPTHVSQVADLIAAVEEKQDFFNSNPDKALKEEMAKKRAAKAKEAARSTKKGGKAASSAASSAAAAAEESKEDAEVQAEAEAEVEVEVVAEAEVAAEEANADAAEAEAQAVVDAAEDVADAAQ